MIWLAILGLCLVVLAPLWLTQRRIRLRGRRETSLALYRAQLAELEQEGLRGRILPNEQAQARLEIERRLLSTADAPEEAMPTPRRSWILPAMLVILPVAAVALYLPQGAPNIPAAPLAPRIAQAEEQMRQDTAMLDMLKAKLATLDPGSEQARQGFVLLGNMEAGMGDASAASAAWGRALAIRPDPKLAALKAEADVAAAQATKSPAAAP
jgi:cytochrome c-type biogenesis protein CcmH